LSGLVSVLTASRNRSKLLAELIASLEAQTYKDWELVVVDNASEDATLAVLEAASKRTGGKVRALPQKENLGFGAGLVVGFPECRGEFLAFMGDDDMLMPEMLSLAVAKFRENPSLGLVHGNCWRGETPGKVLSIDESFRWPDGKVCSTAEYIDPARFRNCIQSTVFARKAFDSINGLDPRYLHYQDVDVVYRLVTRFPSAYIPKPLGFMREHLGSFGLTPGRIRNIDEGRNFWLDLAASTSDPATKRAAMKYVVQHELNCCYFYAEERSWDVSRFRRHVRWIFKHTPLPSQPQAYYFALLALLPGPLHRALKRLKSASRA
jgi:glycosyltransferase involved in cell wall biosynthesis